MTHHSEESVLEIGRVVHVTDKTVMVEIEKGGACHGCRLENLCVTSKPGTTCLEINNTLHAKVGDTVRFSIRPQTRILTSFVVYILPIILLIIVYLLCTQLFHFSENASVFCSLLSLVGSVFLLHLLDKYVTRHKLIQPIMREIITRKSPVSVEDEYENNA